MRNRKVAVFSRLIRRALAWQERRARATLSRPSLQRTGGCLLLLSILGGLIVASDRRVADALTMVVLASVAVPVSTNTPPPAGPAARWRTR